MHENWRPIAKHYNDGGFLGRNMNRPALKELFADIKAGQINMVVVYKIGRISRSLFDFSKIVEMFEKHNVSFVLVTQSLNTSNSSGKLMLNIRCGRCNAAMFATCCVKKTKRYGYYMCSRQLK